MGRQFPQTDKDLSVETEPLKETVVAGVRRSLWILFGSVTLLLLIACTNIAALLLSRTTARAHEISIRYSLGASRGSIIAQLLTEALVLAGSALGLGVAAAGVRIFHSLAKALPPTGEIALDWRLALYTLCCSVIVTLLSGLAPALLASRRIPLLAGTTCKEDTLWTTAVVNRSFVETYLPDQLAVGHHLAITPFDEKPEIIGVVADARENGLNREPVPTLYWCSSNANPSPYFLFRTRGDPMKLAHAMAREIHRLEPARSVFDVMPLVQHLSESNAENRLRTLLLSLFALTAISLAAIGLYGTLSYLVALRHREIGLRMALGALPGQIRSRFIAQGAGVSLLGCIAGLAMAAAFSRLLAGMLYAVSRLDPLTYIAVAIGVLAVTALASALPASRAAHLDPIAVLRHE